MRDTQSVIIDIVGCGGGVNGCGGGFSFVIVIIGCGSCCGRGAYSICCRSDDNVND